jgi:hypothetical protein
LIRDISDNILSILSAIVSAPSGFLEVKVRMTKEVQIQICEKVYDYMI